MLSEICTINLPILAYISELGWIALFAPSEPLFLLLYLACAGTGWSLYELYQQASFALYSLVGLASGKPQQEIWEREEYEIALFVSLTSPQSLLGLAVSFDQSHCPLKTTLSFLVLVIAPFLHPFKSKVIVLLFLASEYSTISCQFIVNSPSLKLSWSECFICFLLTDTLSLSDGFFSSTHKHAQVS